MNNFGQFRGSYEDKNTFLRQPQSQITSLETVQVVNFETPFDNDGFTYHFDANNSYYLQFQIKDLENDGQTISLKLLGGVEEATQLIQTYKITPGAPGSNRKTYTFQAVFTPNGTYTTLCWQLTRTAADYSGDDQRRTNITLKQFKILNNFINNNDISASMLKKIGIQGPPSMLMCINGEQIRIGKSGIYEINNGINITFISFIPKESDYFIFDYEY